MKATSTVLFVQHQPFRWLASLLLVVLVLLRPTLGWGQTTLVNYDFNNLPANTFPPASVASVSTASGITADFSSSEASVTAFSGVATGANAFTANSGGKALALNNSSGNNRYFQFALSGSGLKAYGSYKLYFQLQRSGTGAKTATIGYSTDGVTFTSLPASVSVPEDFEERVIDLSTIAGLNKQSAVYFRLTLSGASGNGTFRIDNFQVQGTATSTPTITGITPTSGPVGTTVTIAGSNLGGITGVSFNGTPAASFNSNSAGTQLTATVAAGTTTGPVTLTDGAATYTGPTFMLTTPAIAATPANLSGFSTTQGVPSAAQSYSVSASGVGNASLTATAPAGYELSLAAGSGFVPTLTLTPDGAGDVPATTLYVRLTGATAGSFSGDITNASAGADAVPVSLTGTVSPVVTLVATPATLTGFTATVGSNSAPKSYQLSGNNLPAPVTVTAATSYEVATAAAGPYSGTLTLPAAGGSLAPTTIYVRLLSSLAAGSYSGGIENTSGAVSKSVTVSGTVTNIPGPAPEPTVAGSLSVGALTATSIRVNITAGNGAGRLLAVRRAAAVADNPVDGLTYAANRAYGEGSSLGPDTYVVLRGTGSGVTVTGLLPGTQYYFRLYEYNGSGSSTNYLTSATATASATTLPGGVAAGEPGELLLEEAFEYPAGTALGPPNNWTSFTNNNNTGPILVADGSLTLPKYGSPNSAGLAASLNKAGEDREKKFFQGNGLTDVYLAMLVKVNSTGSSTADGEYFTGFTAGTSVSTFVGRIFTRSSIGGRFNFGLSFSSTNDNIHPVYAVDVNNQVIDYSLGETYLVVVRYRKNPTAQDDQVRLYVLSGEAPVNEPTTPTVSDITTGSGQEITPGGVLLRQYSNSMNMTVDGIRVGSGWGAVVGRPRFTTEQFSLRAGNYYDVSLNLPDVAAAVPTAGSVFIADNLTLVQGRLTTTAANLLTLGSGASVSAGSTASYVAGPLAWAYAGNGTKTFPLGQGDVFRPATLIINQTGLGTYRLELLDEDSPDRELPANISNRSRVRYYTLERTAGAPTATSGQLTLSYGADDGVNNPANLRILNSYNGGAYTDAGPAAGGTGSPDGFITSDLLLQDFAAQNVFTLGNQAPGTNPLPVQLLSFGAERRGAAVRVQWATATELNSAAFEVQRSATGQQFQTIAHVAGQGTSPGRHDYAAIDYQPLPGTSYYRLRQLDLDGQAAYSAVVSVAAPGELRVYPNPAATALTLEGPAAGSHYRVISLVGGVLLKGELPATGRATLDVAGLPAGLYQLEVVSPAGRTMRKFVKQ